MLENILEEVKQIIGNKILLAVVILLELSTGIFNSHKASLYIEDLLM
jgi:hypothetical protein